MWSNKIVKKNIKSLKELGVHILSPQTGKLACGTKGSGKLMEINQIVDELKFYFLLQNSKWFKAVVTKQVLLLKKLIQ